MAQATHALLFLLQSPNHRVRAAGTHLTGRLKNFSAVLLNHTSLAACCPLPNPPPRGGNWVAVGFSAVGFGKRLDLPVISTASTILLPPPWGRAGERACLGCGNFNEPPMFALFNNFSDGLFLNYLMPV